jgi:hypothetical protein
MPLPAVNRVGPFSGWLARMGPRELPSSASLPIGHQRTSLARPEGHELAQLQSVALARDWPPARLALARLRPVRSLSFH